VHHDTSAYWDLAVKRREQGKSQLLSTAAIDAVTADRYHQPLAGVFGVRRIAEDHRVALGEISTATVLFGGQQWRRFTRYCGSHQTSV
jgi:hypothetical protein